MRLWALTRSSSCGTAPARRRVRRQGILVQGAGGSGATTATTSSRQQTCVVPRIATGPCADLSIAVADGPDTRPDVHSDAARARTNSSGDRCGVTGLARATPRRVRVRFRPSVPWSALTYLCRLHAPAPPPQSVTEAVEGHATESVLGLVPHQLRGFLAQFRTLPVAGAAYDRCTGCSETVRVVLISVRGVG